ncbi:hypothetical protein [Clostridium beijerinckii]|uniref:Uncharacterized protein n=2 Tax=Clostridium beijerinckii TaxID=1520 RepID=A0A7X9SNN2_CLOBE|nr:hypothetical protein [Clostridium beijerinckii]NMF05246.1 hypothetical protein [Clostridium beijerinckii]
MMKKLTTLLISIILLFNIFIVVPVFAVTNFKEGLYQLINFNVSPDNTYSIQNISSTDGVYVIILDENQRTLQSLRLSASSEKYNLIPLKPSYRILIIGNGEVVIL